jgi:hypothetical protein
MLGIVVQIQEIKLTLAIQVLLVGEDEVFLRRSNVLSGSGKRMTDARLGYRESWSNSHSPNAASLGPAVVLLLSILSIVDWTHGLVYLDDGFLNLRSCPSPFRCG